MLTSRCRIEGIVIPMITPFDADENVDVSALRHYTDWLIRQGVHALFTGSGCGEVWKLSTEQKKRMFEIVVETANGRVPVLTGTAEGSTRATIELTRFSQTCGASGAVIWPPNFASYTEDAVEDHYRAIADATAFPVIAYNAPEMCGYAMSPELIARLTERGAIAGLKDSGAQVYLLLKTMALTRGRLPVFQGVDVLLLPSLFMGASGGFCSRANVLPRFIVELYAKARAGAMEDARAMHKKLEALVFSPLLRGDLWQVMKLGLAMQGVSVGAVCRPRFSAPFGQAAIDELRGLLTSCGVETL